MWVFAIFGKGHCSLFFRAPDLVYSEKQEGSIGFINVLLFWKKRWIKPPLAPLPHWFIAGDSSCKVTCRPSLPPSLLPHSYEDPQGRDIWLNSKVQTLHPLIQGFRVPSFSAISWEGDSTHEDSIHAVIPKIKRTMPGLTVVTMLTAIWFCFLRLGQKHAL